MHEYHEICLWLPHRTGTVADIAADMKSNGFRPDRAIVTYEGKILDGRHRYEAALEAGVDPVFTEFSGDKQEAINYVASENVSRRHLNNKEKGYFYFKKAEFLGVNSRGGDRQSEVAKSNVKNFTAVQTAEKTAEDFGVTRRTLQNWERDRKEIVADEELAEKAKTPEGYQEAKKIVKERRMVVPPYDVATTLGALKGMAQMFSKRYEGTQEHAVNVLISELIKGCGEDEIGMSIARDSVKWFLNFKEVLDLAQPKLEDFLEEKPELKIVN
jgi:transcriptional regulator with XRE-family HTH domain